MLRYRWHLLLCLLALFLAACGTGADGADTAADPLGADEQPAIDAAPTSTLEPARATSTPAPTVAASPTPAVARNPGAESAPVVRRNATYEVEVTTEIYGRGLTHDSWGGEPVGEIDLVLDVYEPIDAPPGRPAIVVIHGGGFKGGSRTADRFVENSQYFASRGWVAVSIDYRVVGDHGTVPSDWAAFAESVPSAARDQAYALYPAARDAKAALRWLHENASAYDIDTDHIATLGGSAGSYLAVMLGTSNPEDFRDELGVDDDPTLATTNRDASAAVHVVIDHWGAGSHLEILELIDGTSRFDSTDAPLFIVHGTEDRTVVIDEGEKLRDVYEVTGVPYAFHPIDGGGHGVWNARIDGRPMVEAEFDFIVEHAGLSVTD